MAAKLFTCIIPDFPNVLSKRLAVREQHIANAKALNAKGIVVAGGGYADEHPSKEGQAFDFKGSIITFKAETLEEVKNILQNDIYTKNGVWDLENVKIYPVSSLPLIYSSSVLTHL